MSSAELEKALNAVSNMGVQNCGMCKFFVVNPEDMQQGQCRRYPPSQHLIPSQNGVALMSENTPVQRKAWCGEFIPKIVN